MSAPALTTSSTIADLLAGHAVHEQACSAETASFADVLVANCRAGERLILTHTPSGDRYSLEPSSWPVSGEVARAAIGDGRLVPEHDGLLDAGSAQTWRAA